MKLKIVLRLLIAAACLLATPAFAADDDSTRLISLDGSLASGYVVFEVTRVEPATQGKATEVTLETFRGHLLVARPGQFKLVLRPGEKNEQRIVGDQGKVRWLDVATGVQGSGLASDYLDVSVVALLDANDALKRLFTLKNAGVINAKDKTPVGIVKLDPRAYGTRIVAAKAFMLEDKVAALQFVRDDDIRVFIAILRFDANVDIKPGDFELK